MIKLFPYLSLPIILLQDFPIFPAADHIHSNISIIRPTCTSPLIQIIELVNPLHILFLIEMQFRKNHISLPQVVKKNPGGMDWICNTYTVLLD